MRLATDADVRRLIDQVDELAEDRIKRNARIRELEQAMQAILRACVDEDLPYIEATARQALASGQEQES